MKIFVLAVFAVCALASSVTAYPVFAPEGHTLKVHWAVLEAKPGKMSEMAAISARTVAKYTPDEKGSYSLYGGIDRDNPDIMRILEIYEDEAAYQVHRNSEGFKAFITEREPILEQLIILPVTPIVLEQKAEGTGQTVTMSLIEARTEEFKALITEEMTRAVANDAGVLGMFATVDSDNRVHTLEIFTDENARDNYLASPEYQEYKQKADAMLNSSKTFYNLPTRIILSRKGLHIDD